MRDSRDLIPEGLMVRVAERLRILGQPVRLRLVELLTDGPSTPQELSDALGLSHQNVSKHLLSLHRAGVVVRTPSGSNVFYTLSDPRAAAILGLALDSVSEHLRGLADMVLYLAIQNAVPQWTKTRGWTKAMLAFKIQFGNRIPI